MKIEVYGVIYKITNKINNKIYIGQTTSSFNRRYTGGRWWDTTTNTHLKASAKKYGIDNFEVIKEFDFAMTKEELDEKEKYWINYYKSNDSRYGYNKEDGGAKGLKNKEALLKNAKANKINAEKRKGSKRPQEVVDKIIETKLNDFLNIHNQEEADYIQELFNTGYYKHQVMKELNISEYVLNKIIKCYDLKYIRKSSMAGVTGERHHNFNKKRNERSNAKISDTWAIKRGEIYGERIPELKAMLDAKKSKCYIARQFNTNTKTIRKLIEQYGL